MGFSNLLVDDVQKRLEWSMSSEERQVAESALDTATALALAYGRAWTDQTMPEVVRQMILQAVTRHMRNPEGYTLSKAGDESVSWADDDRASGVYLTDAEITVIEKAAGNQAKAFGSMATYAWGDDNVRTDTIYTPWGNRKPFPMFDGRDPFA